MQEEHEAQAKAASEPKVSVEEVQKGAIRSSGPCKMLAGHSTMDLSTLAADQSSRATRLLEETLMSIQAFANSRSLCEQGLRLGLVLLNVILTDSSNIHK